MGMDMMGLESPSVTLGLDPFKASPPTIAEKCLSTCIKEMVKDSNPFADTSLVAATPIPKLTGAGALGSGDLTTIGSSAALLGKDLPRLSRPLLNTTNVCRAAARANEPVAASIAIYDSTAILSCTTSCTVQGGI
jgi:hypothetical protein